MNQKAFLSFFPNVDLPVTFTDESLLVFSRENKVLPQIGIEKYILEWEHEEVNDYTEYIPCIQLPAQEEFIGIVYWKGGLEKQEYIMVTLMKSGDLIARKSIASTSFQDNIIKKSVASIDEDLIITIMAGANLEGIDYDPNASKAFNMEILHSGDILFSL